MQRCRVWVFFTSRCEYMAFILATLHVRVHCLQKANLPANLAEERQDTGKNHSYFKQLLDVISYTLCPITSTTFYSDTDDRHPTAHPSGDVFWEINFDYVLTSSMWYEPCYNETWAPFQYKDCLVRYGISLTQKEGCEIVLFLSRESLNL